MLRGVNLYCSKVESKDAKNEPVTFYCCLLLRSEAIYFELQMASLEFDALSQSERLVPVMKVTNKSLSNLTLLHNAKLLLNIVHIVFSCSLRRY